MASGKNIEIRIAAVGGDAAAQELRKPADAIRDQAAAAGDLADANEDLAQKNAKALQGREEMLRGVLQATAAMKQYGGELKNAGPELDVVFGAENAGKVREFGEGMENVASAATLAAQGFAIGGPLGAAIGGMVGVLLPEAKKMLDELVEAYREQGEAQSLAATQQAQLNEIHRMGINAYADARDAVRDYKEETEALTDKLREQNLQLTNRNKLLDAKDATEAAKRDSDDAAAIRAGADPEDVKAKRALYDAEVKKRQIDRQIDQAFKDSQAAATELQRREKNVEVLRNDPTVPADEKAAAARKKELEAAETARDAARIAFEKSRANFESARDTGAEKKTQVDERTMAKVEAEEFAKSKRLAEEKRRREEQADREWDAAERRNEARRKSESANDKAAGKIGRDAEKLLPDNVTAEFRRAVQKASERLQDGGTPQELAELAELMSRLGSSTNSAVASIKSKLAAVNAEIATLRNQIKNK